MSNLKLKIRSVRLGGDVVFTHRSPTISVSMPGRVEQDLYFGGKFVEHGSSGPILYTGSDRDRFEDLCRAWWKCYIRYFLN